MFHYSHPNAFFQPHLHPRGCSREYLLGLGCQGCSGACSTPFSRLLQPSVRSVVDLEVMTFGRHPLPYPSLCGRVTLSVGVHSVCAPVSKYRGTGWPPSISGKRAFQWRFILLLVPFFASCYVTRSTSSKLCALASPRLRRSSPGSWLLFQLYSILWVSVCVDASTPGWSSLPLRSLSSRFLYLSSDFVQFLGLSSIPGIPTSYLPRWCSVCGSSSIQPLSGLLRRWHASLGGNLQPPYLCHAPSIPRACGCRF